MVPRLIGYGFVAALVMAWTSPPWGTIPGGANNRQWQVYSALVERAIAMGYDTSTIAEPRPWVFDRSYLVACKAHASNMLETGYWLNRWSKNAGTYDAWFATNRNDFNRLWWTNGTPDEYTSNLYEICRIPTNYFTDTPWAGLSASSNGWPGMTNLLSEMVETRTPAYPTTNADYITDALEAKVGFYEAVYDQGNWTNNSTLADLEGAWTQVYFITNYSEKWPSSYRRQEDLNLGFRYPANWASTTDCADAYANAESSYASILGDCTIPNAVKDYWDVWCNPDGPQSNGFYDTDGLCETNTTLSPPTIYYIVDGTYCCDHGDAVRGGISRVAVPVLSAAIPTNYESARQFYYNASSNGAGAACIGPAIFTNEAISVPLRNRLYTYLFNSVSNAARAIDERWITDAIPWTSADTTTNMSMYPTSCWVAVNWIATTNGFRWR